MLTDETLYQRVITGDGGALEALVRRYHSPMLGYFYRLTDNRHLAEDLVQDLFARLVTYRGQPPRRFKAWIFTVAGNLVRDYYRSAVHRREHPDPFEAGGPEGRPPLADTGPPVDELLLRDDDRRQVVEALHRLSPAQREVLVLRFYHDLSLDEIAAVTGAPVGTVKSRTFHALRQMKVYLHQEGGERYGPEATGSDGRARG